MSTDNVKQPTRTTKLERNGNVTIITLGGKRDADNVLARQLEGYTERLGECHLLLDFTNVEYLSSVELATLVNLHKKVEAEGGRLTLFNLSPHVFETFAITRLHTLLGICREEGKGSA